VLQPGGIPPGDDGGAVGVPVEPGGQLTGIQASCGFALASGVPQTYGETSSVGPSPGDGVSPDEGVSDDGVSEDGVSEDGVSEDGVSEDGVSDDGVSEDGGDVVVLGGGDSGCGAGAGVEGTDSDGPGAGAGAGYAGGVSVCDGGAAGGCSGVVVVAGGCDGVVGGADCSGLCDSFQPGLPSSVADEVAAPMDNSPANVRAIAMPRRSSVLLTGTGLTLDRKLGPPSGLGKWGSFLAPPPRGAERRKAVH
jgi:hypothetical protein